MEQLGSGSFSGNGAISDRGTRFSGWTGLAIFCYGTVFAAFVAFFVYHAQSMVASTIDLNGYGLLSRNIALGKGLSWGYGPTTSRAPLYPLLAGALLKVFGGYAPGVPDAVAYRPILIAQCLIFGLTCLTTWALARRVFGPRVALVAALLCPLVPQSLRYIGMTEVETIMGLFTVLLAYTGLNLLQRPRLSTGAWFGLAAAAPTLTKPVTLFYPFVFLFLLWAWWYWRNVRVRQPRSAPASRSQRLVATSAALLCFALLLLPWTLRNMAVTNGQLIGIMSDGPGQFLRGYVNAQTASFMLRQDRGAWESAANAYEERILRQHGLTFYRFDSPHAGTIVVKPPIPKGVTTAHLEVQRDRIEGAEVRRRLLHEPLGFLRKFLIQLATFWYVVDGRLKSIFTGAVALVVLALAAIGVLHARRQGTVTWPIVAVLVYLNLVYAATLAIGRYSMPLYPTLLVLASGGLAYVASRFVHVGRRPVTRRQWEMNVRNAENARNVEMAVPHALPEEPNLSWGFREGEKISIVMPCLNEELGIARCIAWAQEGLAHTGLPGEIIVADNGSTDRSAEIARNAGATVIHQPQRGYGNAYHKGFSAATGSYIVMGDADQTYDFREVDRLIEPLRQGYDYVLGSRFRGQILPGAMPWTHRYIGNPVLTLILNLLFGLKSSDAHSGLRAFTREAYLRMGLTSPGMEFASELVVKAAEAHLRVAEVPITYYPRAGASKLNALRDGWRHLRFMFAYRFARASKTSASVAATLRFGSDDDVAL